MPSPSPADAPKLWENLKLGTNAFGTEVHPDQILGFPDVEAELGVDGQKAAGKDKEKLKLTGIKAAPGRFEVTYTRRCWNEARAFLRAISPRGPSQGGPFEVVHPEYNDAGVAYVLVKKIGPTKALGPFACSNVVEVIEAEPAKKASAPKGTKTAPAAERYANSYTANGQRGGASGSSTAKSSEVGGASGSTGASGSGASGSSGFNGKNAPSSAPDKRA